MKIPLKIFSVSVTKLAVSSVFGRIYHGDIILNYYYIRSTEYYIFMHLLKKSLAENFILCAVEKR